MELKDFKLSLNLIGRSDINRLLRELEKLDDFFIASAAERQAKVSRVSHGLDELARINKLNLLEAAQRKTFAELLKKLASEVPDISISFATEPSLSSMERVVTWFRTNVHPHALIQVGIQPSIAAGCVVRTPNKIFDFSIRNHLHAQTPYLIKLIQGAPHG